MANGNANFGQFTVRLSMSRIRQFPSVSTERYGRMVGSSCSIGKQLARLLWRVRSRAIVPEIVEGKY